MKKLFSALMAAALLTALTLPVCAIAEVTYTDNTADIGATAVDWPISGETVDSHLQQGAALVEKTLELSPDDDPQLYAEEFERDGLRYTLREILREELPGKTLTRAAVKSAVTTTDSDDQTAILAQFPAYIEHAGDGYTGQLALEPSSLRTGAEECGGYSFVYTEKQEVHGLTRNDPTLLEKERPDMKLLDVSFAAAGDTYTALVTWQGTATGSQPVSYITTATYSGQVAKTVPVNILYTYIYEGAAIAEDIPGEDIPGETQPPREPERIAPASFVPENIDLKQAALTLIGVAYPLVLTALFMIQSRKTRKARRENREALEEIARFIRGGA